MASSHFAHSGEETLSSQKYIQVFLKSSIQSCPLLQVLLLSPVAPTILQNIVVVQSVGLSWGTLMTCWSMRLFTGLDPLWPLDSTRSSCLGFSSGVLPLSEYKGPPTSEYSLSLWVTPLPLSALKTGTHFQFSVSQHPCQHLLLSVPFL